MKTKFAVLLMTAGLLGSGLAMAQTAAPGTAGATPTDAPQVVKKVKKHDAKKEAMKAEINADKDTIKAKKEDIKAKKKLIKEDKKTESTAG
jgi:Skp family chaperone for outer membrane proteins